METDKSGTLLTRLSPESILATLTALPPDSQSYSEVCTIGTTWSDAKALVCVSYWFFDHHIFMKLATCPVKDFNKHLRFLPNSIQLT